MGIEGGPSGPMFDFERSDIETRPEYEPTKSRNEVFREVSGCEATVVIRTLQKPVFGGVHFDLDGRRIDLGEVSETPGKEEATIGCQRCSLHEVLTAEGKGPYGAYNAAANAARASIKDSCPKWKDRVHYGMESGKMPDSFLPHV